MNPLYCVFYIFTVPSFTRILNDITLHALPLCILLYVSYYMNITPFILLLCLCLLFRSWYTDNSDTIIPLVRYTCWDIWSAFAITSLECCSWSNHIHPWPAFIIIIAYLPLLYYHNAPSRRWQFHILASFTQWHIHLQCCW